MHNTIENSVVMHPPVDLKGRIIQVLHHDLERYTTLQYVRGVLYLKIIIEDRNLTAQMERSKIFWDWWKLHWSYRDKTFLSDNEGDLVLTERIMLYSELNNPYKMIADGEFDDSYDDMIQMVRNEIEKNKGD